MLTFCVGGQEDSGSKLDNEEYDQKNFFLLRRIDNLRVPTPRNENALERSGHVKDIIFANNLTNARIKELLLHAFSDHLDANDLPS